MDNKSGLFLFLLFSWPGANELLEIRKITPDDVAHGESLLNFKRDPSMFFLKKCFGYIVDDYIRSFEDSGIIADFSYESVLYYWKNRHNRNHHMDCSVTDGLVLKVLSKSVEVIIDSIIVDMKNPYKLELEEIKDTVLMHRGAIICKI